MLILSQYELKINC